jgi:hypothetical protein
MKAAESNRTITIVTGSGTYWKTELAAAASSSSGEGATGTKTTTAFVGNTRTAVEGMVMKHPRKVEVQFQRSGVQRYNVIPHRRPTEDEATGK